MQCPRITNKRSHIVGVYIPQLAFMQVSEKCRVRGRRLLTRLLGVDHVALALEDTLQQQTETAREYKVALRTAYAVLVRNTELRTSLVNGNMSAATFCRLDPEAKLNSLQKLRRAEEKLETERRIRLKDPPMAESDEFVCGKCRSRRTVYFQKQTRCADEPMTTFVRCVVCDNRWKFS